MFWQFLTSVRFEVWLGCFTTIFFWMKFPFRFFFWCFFLSFFFRKKTRRFDFFILKNAKRKFQLWISPKFLKNDREWKEMSDDLKSSPRNTPNPPIIPWHMFMQGLRLRFAKIQPQCWQPQALPQMFKIQSPSIFQRIWAWPFIWCVKITNPHIFPFFQPTYVVCWWKLAKLAFEECFTRWDCPFSVFQCFFLCSIYIASLCYNFLSLSLFPWILTQMSYWGNIEVGKPQPQPEPHFLNSAVPYSFIWAEENSSHHFCFVLSWSKCRLVVLTALDESGWVGLVGNWWRCAHIYFPATPCLAREMAFFCHFFF